MSAQAFVPALTPGEQRVSDLATEGMSNPEIAARLCITRSAVEYHLTRIYQKLGISSRRDLPGAHHCPTCGR